MKKFLKNFDEIEVVGKSCQCKKDASDFWNKKSPDLLLLDVYMPDQLGTDLLPDIRKKIPECGYHHDYRGNG
ncbi:response regulator [Peribacillus frigoritolerans]|nr:response regulator [Peribacillus frigoritolerans]